MINFNDNGVLIDLNFSDVYVIEKWIKKMILELKGVEKHLCPCKYKILQLKWHEVIYWYLNYSTRIIISRVVSIEDFFSEITRIVESYELLIYNEKTISKKTYSIFRELHRVVIDEFVSEVKHEINAHNKNKGSILDFIEFIGSQLYQIMLNSFFEMNEISIECEDKSCPYMQNVENKSIRFLINNMYNVNNFSVFKLDKFIEILEGDVKDMDFIADFKYFNEPYLSPNILKMLKKTKQLFNSLKIINFDKSLLSTLSVDFSKNI